jgi:hypothetical protein
VRERSARAVRDQARTGRRVRGGCLNRERVGFSCVRDALVHAD